MCEHVSSGPSNAALSPGAGCPHGLPSRPGSRRRRLWELPAHAHCPVIGVCLPVDRLRQLVSKLIGSPLHADDYMLHVGIVSECRRRTPSSERIHKELDARFDIAIRRAARQKTPEALRESWREGMMTGEMPSLFWAILTHSRCDDELLEQVLRDVHMLQHQVGASLRVDAVRHEELAREHRALVAQLSEAQLRTSRVIAEKCARIEQQTHENLRLRAAGRYKDAVIATLQDELAAARAALASRASSLLSSVDGFGLHHGGGEAVALEAAQDGGTVPNATTTGNVRAGADASTRADAVAEAIAGAGAHADALQRTEPAPDPSASLDRLRDKAVLCVGGRSRSVPIYRRLVEKTGGRFVHHDGGEEDSVARLDACLASADLVICQTGCISHSAYWRVKNYCKRTGKQCLFVDKPSATGLARGLLEVAG
jgi:hypothetical protein